MEWCCGGRGHHAVDRKKTPRPTPPPCKAHLKLPDVIPIMHPQHIANGGGLHPLLPGQEALEGPAPQDPPAWCDQHPQPLNILRGGWAAPGQGVWAGPVQLTLRWCNNERGWPTDVTSSSSGGAAGGWSLLVEPSCCRSCCCCCCLLHQAGP